MKLAERHKQNISNSLIRSNLIKRGGVDGKKTCKNCNVEKPLREFYLSTRYYKLKTQEEDVKYGYVTTWCKECMNERARKRHVRIRFELKKQIIKHYTKGQMKCSCCGISGMFFLTIDHVNGDGHIERSGKKKFPEGFYQSIIDAGFPKKYQILCFNCNCTKYHFKECLHKLYEKGLSDEEIMAIRSSKNSKSLYPTENK